MLSEVDDASVPTETWTLVETSPRQFPDSRLESPVLADQPPAFHVSVNDVAQAGWTAVLGLEADELVLPSPLVGEANDERVSVEAASLWVATHGVV